MLNAVQRWDRAQLEEFRCEFRQNGYLVLPGVLSPEETRALVGVVDRLDQGTTMNTQRRPRQPGDVLELRNCVSRAVEFMELVDRPAILELLGVLLGYNIQLGNSHLFMRPGFGPDVNVAAQGGNSWHHDLVNTAAPVNGRLPHLATRVGYFFTPLTQPDSGSILVVPGSHRYAGRPAWDRSANRPYGSVELLVEAGSAVVFDNRLWHATAPNYSTVARKNLYLEYAPRWMRPFDYHWYDGTVLDGAGPVRKQLLGYDFSSIEDGDLGYQQPRDVDVPLRSWLSERGWDVPPLVGD